MDGIFQKTTPHDVTATRPLPGVMSLDPSDWLHVDDAYAAQMSERERLLHTRRDEVVQYLNSAEPAMEELLSVVLDWLSEHGQGYRINAGHATRPDGVDVPIDREDPLGTLGRLVQEDLCVLQRQVDEHVLTAAVVCFPASWALKDKIGRPLSTIHTPVPSYDDNIARRVQRLFDGVRVGRPVWRFNVLNYADADLFQPVRRTQPGGGADRSKYPYQRTERQCVLRLPQTGACVFSIHTYVMAPKIDDPQTA